MSLYGHPLMKVRSSDDGILKGIGRLRAGVDLLERSMRSEDWRTAGTSGSQYSGNPMYLTLTIGYFCSNDLNCSRK